MQIGLLWFDDDPGRDMEQKVSRAARHYKRKHGVQPTICYVHPSMLEKDSLQAGEVKIEGKNSVLRHHFWIGEENTDG